MLADDHAEVLEATRQLLAPEFDVLCAVQNGQALLEATARWKPDAVVSDIQMPGMDGIAAGTQMLRSKLCDAVVVLTMYNEPHLADKALRAGIRGFVLKVDAGEELIPAIYAVVAGARYISRGFASRGAE